MQHSEEDIAAMRQRIADGVGSDTDRRLVKLYDKGEVTTIPAQQTSPATAEEVAAVLTEGEPETYEGEQWTKEALVEECRRRELAVSGNKDELAARLRADDASDLPLE